MSETEHFLSFFYRFQKDNILCSKIRSFLLRSSLRCFALLLLHGAAPDLSRYRGMDIPPYVYSQCSVAHAIIKYRSVRDNFNKIYLNFDE